MEMNRNSMEKMIYPHSFVPNLINMQIVLFEFSIPIKWQSHKKKYITILQRLNLNKLNIVSKITKFVIPTDKYMIRYVICSLLHNLMAKCS